METTVINATEYLDLPLSLLTESKTNPRRIFDVMALNELADFVPKTQNLPYVPLIILWPNQHGAASPKAVRVPKGT